MRAGEAGAGVCAGAGRIAHTQHARTHAHPYSHAVALRACSFAQGTLGPLPHPNVDTAQACCDACTAQPGCVAGVFAGGAVRGGRASERAGGVRPRRSHPIPPHPASPSAAPQCWEKNLTQTQSPDRDSSGAVAAWPASSGPIPTPPPVPHDKCGFNGAQETHGYYVSARTASEAAACA